MKLLITNDDGIDSLFLCELIFALQAAGHDLFVVAPVSEQSWTGASKTRNRPVKSQAVNRSFNCPTWVVDGTPSDCVNIAIAHLLPGKVDAVVSGINVGFNCTIGFIIASGTVAGAWEGALHGLPAMAISQDVSEDIYYHLKDQGSEPNGALLQTLKNSATHSARLASEILPATPPRSFIVHNVNLPDPCRPDTLVRRTIPAQIFVPGLFTPADNEGRHKLIWTEGEDVSSAEPLTDLKCLTAGAISYTILDYRKLGQLA